MGILSSLGPVAYGAGQIANRYIDEELAQQRAQALADIQRSNAQQMDEYTNSPERRAKLRAQGSLDTQQTQADALKGETTRLADPALRQATIDSSNSIMSGTSAAKAAAEGASTLAKDENTSRDIPPGGQQVRGGKVIYENTRLTAGENRAANPGATKIDHYNDKEWATLRTPRASAVTFDDAMGGKGRESPELAGVHFRLMNELRNGGQIAAGDAAEIAHNRVTKIKQLAEDRVVAAKASDKRSSLTEEQAVRQIIAEEEVAAERAKAAKAKRDSSPGPELPPKAAPPAKPIMDRARDQVPMLTDRISSMSIEELKRIASTPGHLQQERAQAEINRREMDAVQRSKVQQEREHAEIDRRATDAVQRSKAQGSMLTDKRLYR